MSMSEHVTTSQGKRRRWLLPTTAVSVLLAGWMTYMLVWQNSTLRLPDGSTLSFLESTEATGSYPAAPLPDSYHFERKHKKTAWESVWKRLPYSLQRHLPTPLIEQGISTGISFRSKQALWFGISPQFDDEKWRFFWVDDQGYESEAWGFGFHRRPSPSWNDESNRPWMAFEGRVPRAQKYLHLRVRTREGESVVNTGQVRVDGKLGQVVAELKVPNPLGEDKAPPLTRQSLPAKATCRDDAITLTRVVRARVASMLTGGLRFEMYLNDHEPINRRYSLCEWIIEDAKGNIMCWPASVPSGEAQVLGNALWSDAPVWRARFWAFRNLDSDYAPEEKITFQRVPLLPTGRESATTQPWQEELTLHGHKIRLHDLQSEGSSEITFLITVSPRTEKQVLMMLRVADAQGNGYLPESDNIFSYRQSMEMVEFPDEDTVYRARLSRPAVGDHMTITFGMDTGVPVEFTFRPEFEP